MKMNMNNINNSLIIRESELFSRRIVDADGAEHYSTCASDVGLPPGVWPKEIHITAHHSLAIRMSLSQVTQEAASYVRSEPLYDLDIPRAEHTLELFND